MDAVIIDSDSLFYGMMALFPYPENEHLPEVFATRPGEVALEWVSPKSYWARVENIRRREDQITFSTWDHNGYPIVRTAPANSRWIVRKKDVMNGTTQPKFDVKFYEEAMYDALKTSFEKKDLPAFDAAVERLVDYLHNNPEAHDDVPDDRNEIKIYLLTQLIHGFFDVFGEIDVKAGRRRK